MKCRRRFCIVRFLFNSHTAVHHLKTKRAFVIKAQTKGSCNTERDPVKIKSGRRANRFHRPLLWALKINLHQRLCSLWQMYAHPEVHSLWRPALSGWCNRWPIQSKLTEANRALTRTLTGLLLILHIAHFFSQPRFITWTSRYGSVFDATLITAGKYDRQQICLRVPSFHYLQKLHSCVGVLSG